MKRESEKHKAVKECLIEGNVVMRKGKIRGNEVCIRRKWHIKFFLDILVFLFPTKAVGMSDFGEKILRCY